MADWGQFTPEQAGHAKMMASGGFGAAVLVYLRHPGSLVRVVGMLGIGVGGAAIFGPMLASYSGLSLPAAGAMIGLCGKAAAEGVLRAVERVDFAAFVPGKKRAD